MRKSTSKALAIAISTIASLESFSGCHRGNANSAAPAPETSATQASPEPTFRTAFERDLQYVRNGQFGYVWVFSRRDRRPLDKDDGDFLRKTAPQVVDWVTTDEGKKVIAGTNFNLEPGSMDLLKRRFIVEDYTGK